MRAVRRLPSWLLVVAVAAVLVATLKLESADLFPAWRFAVQWSPEALPSSTAVPSREIASGRPVLSLTLADADLHDPAKGLLPNKLAHGADWEREGSVSYFEDGVLRFASGVGVRIHGGSSRQTAPKPGFRLYFRRKYGPRELPPGILFSPRAQPIRRLIVHDDVRVDAKKMAWHFVNPLAYDIAREIGAIAPETKPVRFFVNGEYYGPFVLTERFDERYFAAHWGYDDILLSQDAMNDLWEWVRTTRPLTAAAIRERVDLDNLTRWFLAVAFSATRDAYQGPGQLFDRTRPAGWFWVNWDMDQSFRDWNLDSFQYLLERVAEARRGRNPAEPRSVIISQLIAEDASYREQLKREIQRALNHKWTDAFLMGRYEHYLDAATELEVGSLDYLPLLRRFLERRRDFFRLTSEQWLNTPPSQPVVAVVPQGLRIRIDGEPIEGRFTGRYFPDVDLVAEMDDEFANRLEGWRLNGEMVSRERALLFRATRPTVIEAVLRGAPTSPVMPDLPALSIAPPPAAPRPIWRAIPAGQSWMGCVPGDDRCDDAERPRVRVSFERPFEMLDREVSAGDFRGYAAATGRMAPRQPEWYADDTHPVVNVTWDEAQAYCAWAGGRLPTEAEWEHAARGGLDGQLFPWGSEFTGQANARHNLPSERFEFTAPVALFPPNAYGLHDVAGNVWEWTASRFTLTHAANPDTSGYDLRTIKGGGWDNFISRTRVSERAALSRTGRHNLYVGFRCVR